MLFRAALEWVNKFVSKATGVRLLIVVYSENGGAQQNWSFGCGPDFDLPPKCGTQPANLF